VACVVHVSVGTTPTIMASSLRRALLLAFFVVARAQDGDDDDEPKEKSKRDIVAQYAYCMEDNCYELLGVEKDAGGITIKRSYRKLATEWHPDKNPDPRAKELFQKYANAYEVLSSPEMRDNYDYLLDHPYEFPMHFMRFSRAKYVPKTDLRAVLIIAVLSLSAVQFFFLKSKYEISVKSIKASPRYQEQLKKMMAEEFKVGVKKTGGSAKNLAKAGRGDKADDAKKAAEAKLEEEVVNVLVQPPKYQDTLAWYIFVLPLTIYYDGQSSVAWFMRYKVKGEEYDAAAKALLTKKALNMDAAEWASYSEAEQEEFLALELWVKENLAAYEEEEGKGKGKKSAKQKREERAAKRRTGKFVMDD